MQSRAHLPESSSSEAPPAWLPGSQLPRDPAAAGDLGQLVFPSTLPLSRRRGKWPFLALPSAIIQLLTLFVCKLCIVLNANISISKGPATDELKGPESLVLGPCCMRRGRWIEKALTLYNWGPGYRNPAKPQARRTC